MCLWYTYVYSYFTCVTKTKKTTQITDSYIGYVWITLLNKQITSGTAKPCVNTWRERERDVLFNDALNTFYLQLYGVRHIVKDHSDSEKGNPLPPHRLILSISSKGSFICTFPDRITHTTAFVTPVVEHWLEREIAQWVHPMKDRSEDPSHHERTLYLWATSRSCEHVDF